MQKLRNKDYFWKNDTLYVRTSIEILKQTVDVCVKDIIDIADISKFALLSLDHIQNLTADDVEEMKDNFWIFAQNCMEGGNFGADPSIIKGGKEQLEWSMNYLGIHNKEDAFNKVVVKFADTSNSGYGGHVDGINSSYKLWFETPWNSHMTVVSFRNGKVYDYCEA